MSPEYVANVAAGDNFKGSSTHPRLEAVRNTCFTFIYYSQSKRVNKRREEVVLCLSSKFSPPQMSKPESYVPKMFTIYSFAQKSVVGNKLWSSY